MEYSNIEWVCTDPDTQQYGRKIAENHYQFKENGIGPIDIYLDHYNESITEYIINAYGHTLFQNGNHKINIQQLYGEQWKWVVAECIFETEEAPFRK